MLVKEGWRCRVYIRSEPEWYPYLMRPAGGTSGECAFYFEESVSGKNFRPQIFADERRPDLAANRRLL